MSTVLTAPTCGASLRTTPTPARAATSARAPPRSRRARPPLDRLLAAAWALCGTQHDAEDPVQGAVARVLRQPRTLERGDELGCLLCALRNTYRRLHRTRMRRPREQELPEEAALRARGHGDPLARIQAREVFAEPPLPRPRARGARARRLTASASSPCAAGAAATATAPVSSCLSSP